MEELTVSNVMSTPVYVVLPDEPLSRARNLMLKHKVSRLVVVDERTMPVGMITQVDILNHLRQPDAPWRRRPVDSIPVRNAMSDRLIRMHGEATLQEAVEVMLENNIRGVPVVGEELEGMIALTDITRHIGKLDPDVLVRDVMDDFVVSVHTQQSVPHVIEKMQENEVEIVVVKEAGCPVGVISSTNLALLELTELMEGAINGKETQPVAEDVMNRTIVLVSSNDRIGRACKLMVSEGLQAIPTVDEHNELCGVVSHEDIASILITEES
ncbi:MAG: CBS domain-containing protein [Methermicoccaceae archaeon]